MPSLPESPISWEEAVPLLGAHRGVVMLVGAVDVGKTTLTLAAANAAVEGGARVAILDTDLGQSEVGPPGTLGVVRLEHPVSGTGDLEPRALAFVGATQPQGHFLSVVQGTRRLVRHAQERGDQVVFVDTSGMVHGRMAEKLKLAKLTVLEPELVVAVERDNELDRLLRLMRDHAPAPILRVRSSPEVRKKSTLFRKVQRANRMRRHFEGARRVDFDAGRLVTVDGWLYSGRSLPARQLRLAAEALQTEIPHGEETADGIYLCANGRPERKGYPLLQEEFGRRRIVVASSLAFQNLLVGLTGHDGYLLDIGLLQGVNFERALLSVVTPLRSLGEVRQLHFGRLRLRPDGHEIAHLRPSDL